MITSLLVSSVACGGAVVLAPASGAAVPAASCTVTPNADGTAVTISGEGFTAPRKLNDGESTEDLNVDATGHFLLTRFQKNVNYTVLAVNEDQPFVFVNCKRVPSATSPQSTSPTQPNSRHDRAAGRAAGAKAGAAAAAKSCATPPVADKSGPQHSAVYWNSWTQAANRAFHRACQNR
ncbi:hypothetical protein [Streptomyces sp. NPDC054961]